MAVITADLTDINLLESLCIESGANYAIILHDRDDGSDHFHIALTFDNPRTIQAIANLLKMPPNFIEKWDSRVNNLYSYLFHSTTNASANKVSYSDYLDNQDKFRTNIDIQNQITKKDNKLVDVLIQKIATGLLTRKQLLSQEYLLVYMQNFSKLNIALRLKNESLIYNPPDCITILISGESGKGKTTKAVEIASSRFNGNYAIASSDNDPLQDYSGEPCLIIDDFRPQYYDFLSLLSLLDPYHRQRTHKSRYYNKPLATELIIITSTLNINQICNYYETATEDMKQLRRRIPQLITYDSENNQWTYFNYQPQLDAYTTVEALASTVKHT